MTVDGQGCWVVDVASHTIGQIARLAGTCHPLGDSPWTVGENETAGPNPHEAADVGPAFCLGGTPVGPRSGSGTTG